MKRFVRLARAMAGAAAMTGFACDCLALPSFARQLNMQCIACHTEFPILNDLGREFKLSGYTLSAEQTDQPPIAVMLQPSFTRTQAGQSGGAAPDFAANDNVALSQASLFYAGRLFGPYASKWLGADAASLLNKIGVFSQTTYNGIANTWSWDNTDLRFADSTTQGAHALQYGADLNNNPTVEDLWNTVPAWGFPFSGSGLAPTPAAAPLIASGLAGRVAGFNLYAMIDNSLYLDAGVYRSLGSRYQRALGVDPSGETEISGLAPYWRAAFTRPVAGATWEVGAFGLAAQTYPGRDSSAGTDTITDCAVDSQLQKSIGKNDLTAYVTAIYEHDRTTASQALGNATRASDRLLNCKVTVDYLWDKTYGCAAQCFSTQGSSDALAYPTSQTGSPNSDGLILQANYLPLNEGNGPAFWPRSNLKLSVQYVIYNRFDGSSTDVDGAGRTAADNDTLYLEAWLAF